MPRRVRSAAASLATASLELALPRDFGAAYGRDVDRGLCLGGGGLYFVAWQVGYLQTLANLGIRFDDADRVVGTSAGSMVATALTGGKLKRCHAEVSLLAKVPVPGLGPGPGLHPEPEPAAGPGPVHQGHRRGAADRAGDRPRRPGRGGAQA